MSAAGEPAASCPACAAWGILYAGVCRGCYDFARRHQVGPCGRCWLHLPLKKGYCRSCWLQAALQAAGTARRAPDLGLADFAAVAWHQLSFARGSERRGPYWNSPAGGGSWGSQAMSGTSRGRRPAAPACACEKGALVGVTGRPWPSPGAFVAPSSTSVVVGHQLAHPGRLPHRAVRLELDRVWLDVQDRRSVDGVEPLHGEL